MNKGMPFWEQHIEKLVLGLTVVVLLAVLAMLVMGTNAVTTTVDNKEYESDALAELMVERASELERRLSPNFEVDISAFEEIDAAGGADFSDRLVARTGPSGEPPRIAPALAAQLLPAGVGSVDVWYYEPAVPAPIIRDQVAQAIDTIEPSEFDRVSELSSMLSGDADVAWTTPMATLDLVAIRKEMFASSDARSNPPRVSVPSNWSNDRPYALDVVFERQMLDDGGAWGPVEVVGAVPGGIGLRAEMERRRDEDLLDADFKELVWLELSDRVRQLEILQPEFFATVNSASAIVLESEPEDGSFEDPVVDDADAARRQQERELERRIKDKRRVCSRIRATLEDLGGPLEESELDDEKDRNSGGRGGGRDGGFVDPGGGGAGFGQGGAGRKSGGNTVNEGDRRRRIGLTKKLAREQEELARLEAQLAALNPEAAEVEGGDDVVELADIAQVEELVIWTHDLQVVPGEVYRYRCRVDWFNPFFARERQLLPDQQGLSESFTLPSATSGWSKPVRVAPPVEFFVVSAADEGGSLGLGEARVELYRYEEGARRTKQFKVQPGERVGTPATVDGTMVDFQTDWYLVDVIADPSSAGGAGLDREQDATAVFRRLDGTERRIRVPSRELVNPERARLKVDTESASG